MTSLCKCGGKPGEFCGREVDTIAPVCWGQWCRPCAELHTGNKGAPCAMCQPPKAAASDDKDQRIAALEARLAASEETVRLLREHDQTFGQAAQDFDAQREAENSRLREQLAASEECVASLMRRLSGERVDRWHATRDAVAGGLAGHPNAGMFRTPAALMAAAANYADVAHGPLTPDAPKGEVKP